MINNSYSSYKYGKIKMHWQKYSNIQYPAISTLLLWLHSGSALSALHCVILALFYI